MDIEEILQKRRDEKTKLQDRKALSEDFSMGVSQAVGKQNAAYHQLLVDLIRHIEGLEKKLTNLTVDVSVGDVKIPQPVINLPRMAVPQVNVAAPNVKVAATDLNPLLKELRLVKEAIKPPSELDLQPIVDQIRELKINAPESDLKPILKGLRKIEDAINGMVFPVSSGGTGNDGTVTILDPTLTQQKLIDYDIRTDSQPVYVGFGERGMATNNILWTIQLLTYDASNRLLSVKTAVGSWDTRATLSYS